MSIQPCYLRESSFFAPPAKPIERTIWPEEELAWKIARIVESGHPMPLFATAAGVWFAYHIEGLAMRGRPLWRVRLRCYPDLRFGGDAGLIPFIGEHRPGLQSRRIPIA